MSSLPFDRKPFLAYCGSRSFFIADPELTDPGLEESKLEVKLNARFPGKRWLRRTNVHFCAGQFFFVEADGLCRACRKGGACSIVKVRALEFPEPKRKRPEAQIVSVEENLFIEQFIEKLSSEELKMFRTFSISERETFRRLCVPVDDSLNDTTLETFGSFGPLTPTYRLASPEEEAIRAEAQEADADAAPYLYLYPRFARDKVGAPISRRRTLSAEEQKRKVRSAFDYILKHRT